MSGGGDPAATPFERLSGGPRDSDDQRGRGGGKQLFARLVSAPAHVAGRWGPTTSSGGALARALLDETDDNAEEAATATPPAPPPPPPPPSPPARLKILIHERLQQLKDAIGEGTSKAERAATTTTPTTPVDLASAARSRGRELLPERIAALLTSSDGTTPLAFVCPLTHEVMADPVVAPDGYTYERAAIEGHCARAAAVAVSSAAASLPKRPRPKRGPPTSPMTGEPLPRAVALVPNRVLASIILEWGEREGRRGRAGAAVAEAAAQGGSDAAAP
jgi:hypothetical protein